jgi:hypothetical protein
MRAAAGRAIAKHGGTHVSRQFPDARQQALSEELDTLIELLG